MSSRPLVALMACALTLLAAAPAAAHQLGRSYCTVLTVAGGLDVTLETSAEHLAPVLGSESPPDDAEVMRRSGEIATALRERVTARTPAGPCDATVSGPELLTREGVRASSMTLHFVCPQGLVTLKNEWRLDVDPASEIVCAIDGAAWVFRLGLEEKAVGTPPSLAGVLGAFVKLGVHHVLSGIDHVLFVLVLLLAAARAARDGSMAAGLKSMAGIVTGFTLGHSVTLIAAGLGWVRVDPRVTESIIALSIVVVGAENVLREEVRWRIVTATLFGLVHGFGFASVLAETELPRRGAVSALLAFNVGIELAQLGIVLVVFPLLALGARKPWYGRYLLRPVSLAVAALALVWFAKRAFALELLPWLGS